MKVGKPKQGASRREYRPYRFPGQEAGERLASWLNGPPDKHWESWTREMVKRIPGFGMNGNVHRDGRARDRIIELLQCLQRIQQVFWSMEDNRKWPMPDELLNRLKDPERIASNLLRRYVSSPGISANRPYHDGKQRKFLYGKQAFAWSLQPRAAYLLQEHWAIVWIENLSKAGALNRLRRCDVCQRFFYAKRPDALYCGARCQQKRYDSPSYKAWRRNYDQDRKVWLASDVVRSKFQSFAAFRDFRERERTQS